ncbi:MAG: hypothetical protein HFJ37_04300 [Clostridia bacterium]|nr:hypothetical protein [Clostridia bacterium]
MEDMHIHLKAGVTNIEIMRKYVEKCKELNINRVLFLDHGNRISERHTPVLNNVETITQFFENIKKIRKEYTHIEINAGIESDFSYNEEFKIKELKIFEEFPFDYIIGSVHGMAKNDYKEYLQANIDMINTYPINILGHLKLRKEFEEYKETIEEIVRIATQKNIKFDVNTSERSRWNLKQLEYMLGLFKKYGTNYTIGSDAHCIEEIGYHIKEEYTKIDKILNNAKRDIEYTIVSRGTERYGSQGYMGITKIKDNKRFFLLSKHYDKYIDTYKDSFEISSEYTIENIAISRFELMSALTLKPILNIIKDSILIIGFGNLGFASLLYLLENGYKNINILVRETKMYQVNVVEKLNALYNANILLVTEYSNHYSTYIEATGSSKVIHNIMGNIENGSNIILMGMPQEKTYLIDPLDISRKSLKIIGGHELNGHTMEERTKVFIELLESNKNKVLDEFVSIYNAQENTREKILKEKNNFIEVIKYDI